MKSVLKVVLLGDAGVGKTSLMHRYVKKIYIQNYRSTIGTDFMVKNVNMNGAETLLHIWDTAGQERFHGLGPAYYRGADCCVLVFDVTNPSTFLSLDNWRSEFLKMAALHDPDIFPFVLLGNKVELGPSKVHPTLVKLWCEAHNGIPYIETSAKENINVQLAFQTITRVAYDYDLIEDDCLWNEFVIEGSDLPKVAVEEKCCF